MAKLKVNLVVEEGRSNFLRVWTPMPVPMKKLIEAIEGVVRVHHNEAEGYLNVWFNLCYDKDELIAEIKALTD